MRPRTMRSLALSITVLLSARTATAQQAIISMPSADITGPRQFFLMHESQLRLWGARRYWAGTYFLTYGLGYGTELAATLFDLGVNYDGSIGNTTLALGFKSGVRLFTQSAPAWQFQISFGAMAMVSLVNRGVGTWMYALQSFRLPVLRTRLGIGVSYATEQLYGTGYNQLSAMASIEQPLPIPRVSGLSLVAEWFSGSHELSNFILGLTWHPTPTWIFVLGWKVPTRDAVFHIDEQALVAEVGAFFPTIGGRRPEDRSPFDDDHDDVHDNDHDNHGSQSPTATGHESGQTNGSSALPGSTAPPATAVESPQPLAQH